MKKTILAVAVALCAQGFALESSAAVLTFESLAANNDLANDVGNTYVEQGFLLNNLTAGYQFAAWGNQSIFFSGSTALMNNNDSGLTELSRVGGGVFALKSLDLTAMFPGFGLESDVTFNGTRKNGSTVTQTFHVADAGVQTFSFSSAFDDLTAVVWANDAGYHQFDNLNVTPVPEPETYGMLLAGLGLMGFISRRRSVR